MFVYSDTYLFSFLFIHLFIFFFIQLFYLPLPDLLTINYVNDKIPFLTQPIQ